MSRVRAQDTAPEMIVRKVAHALGLRFRLHRRDLPGTPDLVFPKYKIALFVHGCFWHRHAKCKRASMPKSQVRYWTAKFLRNVARDRRAVAELRGLGWRPAVIWECQTKNPRKLARCLERCFSSAPVRRPRRRHRPFPIPERRHESVRVPGL